MKVTVAYVVEKEIEVNDKYDDLSPFKNGYEYDLEKALLNEVGEKLKIDTCDIVTVETNEGIELYERFD